MATTNSLPTMYVGMCRVIGVVVTTVVVVEMMMVTVVVLVVMVVVGPGGKYEKLFS